MKVKVRIRESKHSLCEVKYSLCPYCRLTYVCCESCGREFGLKEIAFCDGDFHECQECYQEVVANDNG